MRLRLDQNCPFPECGYRFSVPAETHGRSVRCPGCGQAMTVLAPETIRRREAERLRLAIAQSRDHGAPTGDRMRRDPGFHALLENVRSLWNVGSIFRTADGAGIGELILSGITGTPPRPEIGKTALGAEEVVPWSYEAEPLAAARRLRSRGVRLLALETGGDPIEDASAAGPLCLVIGHEVAGISPALLELADQRVCLPMRGVKESLNVAVAFGIAAYHLAGARASRPEATLGSAMME